MSITEYITMAIDLAKRLIPLLASIAFFIFVWNIGTYIRKSDAKDTKAKDILIWGVLGLFVLVTIWGIVSFLKQELGFGSGLIIPQIKF